MKLKFVELRGPIAGIVGMLLCFAALWLGVFIDITGNTKLFGDYNIAGIPAWEFYQMMLFELGAVVLCLSAFLAGKVARLFQVQEVALIIYGAIFFLPISVEVKLTLRILASIAVVFTTHRMGLLKGWINKVGCAGLESLGYAYLLNAPIGFALGSFLLSVYSGVNYKRKRFWVDLLFFVLNVPFCIVATAKWAVVLAGMTGSLNTLELLVGIGLVAYACAVATIGLAHPWFRLNGDETERIGDGKPIVIFSEDEGPPWLEVGVSQTRHVSSRAAYLLNCLWMELCELNQKVAHGQASEEDVSRYDKLCAVYDDCSQHLLYAIGKHGLTDCPYISEHPEFRANVLQGGPTESRRIEEVWSPRSPTSIRDLLSPKARRMLEERKG